MDELKTELREREQFAIARWPWFARFNRGPLHFPDRDHLPCMRFGELTAAGETAAAADLGKIAADMLLCLRHFLTASVGVAPALQFSNLNHAS